MALELISKKRYFKNWNGFGESTQSKCYKDIHHPRKIPKGNRDEKASNFVFRQ